MYRRRGWLLALVLITAGCSRPSGSAPFVDLVEREPDKMAVYEAVFRDHLGNAPAESRYYLQVENGDPAPELLASLRKTWPKLEPASRQPAKEGMLLYVRDLRWEGRDAAVVRLGHTLQTKYAPEQWFADFRVVRKRSAWVVEGKTNVTVS